MPSRSEFDARSEKIEQSLHAFDDAEPLTRRSRGQLEALLINLDEANAICQEIVFEHERREPSQSWFLISVAAGVGGLIVTGPGAIPIIIAIGGAAGAGKSIADFYSHENAAQHYRVLSWRISTRLTKLKAAMAQRGLL